jgi:hypothetical protein
LFPLNIIRFLIIYRALCFIIHLSTLSITRVLTSLALSRTFDLALS